MESEETESENTVAALITLLGMTMKNVQKPLLKQKFGLVNQLLHENLIKYNSDYIHRHVRQILKMYSHELFFYCIFGYIYF